MGSLVPYTNGIIRFGRVFRRHFTLSHINAKPFVKQADKGNIIPAVQEHQPNPRVDPGF